MQYGLSRAAATRPGCATVFGPAVAVKPPTITNFSTAAVMQLLWGATEVWLGVLKCCCLAYEATADRHELIVLVPKVLVWTCELGVCVYHARLGAPQTRITAPLLHCCC